MHSEMWTFIKNSQNIQTSKAQITTEKMKTGLIVCNIRKFKIPRRRRQREHQKNNRLNRQKENFAHASLFFVHFFFVLSLYDYDMKLPNFTLVYEGRKQATLEFSLSLSQNGYCCWEFGSRRVRLYLTI